MRTTVDLPSAFHRRAKEMAERRGLPLSADEEARAMATVEVLVCGAPLGRPRI